MQYTTSATLCALVRVLPTRIHVLAVLCFVALALLGVRLEISGGWLVWPPALYTALGLRRRRSAAPAEDKGGIQAVCWYVERTWPQPFLQGLLLQMLWWTHGHGGLAWGALVPWLGWACPLSGLLWPSLTRHPEWWLVERLAAAVRTTPLWLAIALALEHGTGLLSGQQGCLAVGLVTARSAVTVRHDTEHRCYTAELRGHFTLRMADDDPFRLRLFVLAVRGLDDDGPQRGSRRTRDGRTPAVRQQMLAERLGIPQPDISRWERYAHAGDWRRLLSQHAPQILTHELQEQIIGTWAHWPQWTSEEVWRFLVGQGVAVTHSQVEQAGQESGWQIVRQTLGRLCAQGAEGLRLRDDWLVGDLLRQNEMLVDKVEGKQGLTQQETLDVAAWQKATAAAGLVARAPLPLRPWLRRVEQVLFQPWAQTMVGDVRCTSCGSAEVGRKSRIPRFKRVTNEAGEVHWLGVYRYYCKNPACPRKSFTALPPGVLPYTAEGLERHVLVVQMYAWGRSVYRRTGAAVGVR
jgi:hypothetical protein